MITPALRNAAMLDGTALPLPDGQLAAGDLRTLLGQYECPAVRVEVVTSLRIVLLGPVGAVSEYTVSLPVGTVLQVPYYGD
jgi:hypothetical protein